MTVEGVVVESRDRLFSAVEVAPWTSEARPLRRGFGGADDLLSGSTTMLSAFRLALRGSSATGDGWVLLAALGESAA